MSKPVVGILTLYLNDRKALEERPIYEKMITAGARMGMKIFVYTPEDVAEDDQRIRALIYKPAAKRWTKRWVRPPEIIYDRCRYQKSRRFEQLLAYRKRNSHLTFLNRPLRNKWTVHRTLADVSALRSHLPETRLFQSPDDVKSLLKKFVTVYLKPINGTGGRGILRIDRQKDGTLLLQGRNHSRSIVQPRRISRSSLAIVLGAWDMHGDHYIVQQGLNIKLPNGRIHDYRMLVQKNGSGEWEVTGCAGRVGPLRSVTSNLHGGGAAVPMNNLLRQWIESEETINEIRTKAESFGVKVARHLESSYGALCELALDLAIDRKGRIWLIEVNPKPAREVFIRAGESEVYQKAILRPIEYALWVHRQQTSKAHSLQVSDDTPDNSGDPGNLTEPQEASPDGSQHTNLLGASE
ncbi:YheC/YheD family endospore coat-associated protein [Cohnella kolymensis]|uniref:YheC/YheD family endospore coat-associated protein n=1 Tax=Cohnella kolymensis TaxID=1590652 RepID=UPI000698CBAC|nr:YheC/YheD family protein [Cohnella kolymensis]